MSQFTLEVSKRSVEIDLSKITISEFRLAVDTKSDTKESDKVLAKATGIPLKELQSLSYPDYQQLVAEWWSAAINPLKDNKRLAMSEDDLAKHGLKYGQSVEIVRPDEPEPPNSQSASTKE